jgi:ATP-binding cassette subfamily F protein uup
LEKKAERQEQLGSTIDKARNTMRKELDWIRRQPKARGTKQKARVDSFQDLKAVASQRIDEDELEIPIKMERLGSKIVEIHKMNKAFGEKKIINDFSYVFKRQERVGIVGNNGTGKSTFLNMVQGFETLDKGTVSVGDTIVFGYFNQELIKVDEEKKVIDVIRDIAEFIPLEKGKTMSAASFLEKFLFPRSMHHNYVYKLSGGEKRRLKLMTILMKNPNFLILDEPTNDLDIFVMSVLEDYLRSFQGCLIVVSHDRYFMDKMVDHLFVFDGEGEIKDIFGNYTVYRQNIAQLLKDERKGTNDKKLIEPIINAVKEKEAEKRKLNFKEKVEFKNMEKDIENLELEKATLTEKLSNSSLSNAELMNAGNRLTDVIKELEHKADRWLELAEFAE